VSGPRERSLRLRDLPMILMYHGVAEAAHDPNRLCVTPQRFADQMAWLERRGLRGTGIATLVDAMRAGRHRGLVGITFDDGYASVLDAALPRLRRHGFGATAFVISDRLGGSNDWDEGPRFPLLGQEGVRELAAAGIEIGSHSATHPRLAGLGSRQLTDEISCSRSRLAGLLGADVRGFAYPYGSMDATARRAVRDAGYDYACAVQVARADLGPAALPRFYVGQQDDAARLAMKWLLYRGRIALRRKQAVA
jgi:peptidoglycan/xylan/chitin deacetylase (PgdA/CDA1 family)